MKLKPNYWSPRYRCCPHSAFSFVSPPTHSVCQQLLLPLSPNYDPYPAPVFHGHYHFYPSTMISCLFYYTIIYLPAFTFNLLQPTPSIYLKCEPNNVIALPSHYIERKKYQVINFIHKSPHNIALTDSPESTSASKAKEVGLPAQIGGEVNSL